MHGAAGSAPGCQTRPAQAKAVVRRHLGKPVGDAHEGALISRWLADALLSAEREPPQQAGEAELRLTDEPSLALLRRHRLRRL